MVPSLQAWRLVFPVCLAAACVLALCVFAARPSVAAADDAPRAVAVPVAASQPATSQPAASARPKKIYAHLMGCYPVAAAATAWHRTNDAHKIRHDGTGQFDAIGDRWRNWPLVPDGTNLSLEQAADLEIRRALRGGIDGFAMDAWAGGDGAKKYLDVLFKVAEEKDYPFELTICLDTSCGAGDNPKALAQTIREVLDKHGKSPKLARRDGKPIIFGYMTIFVGAGYAQGLSADTPEARGKLWTSVEWRTSPATWDKIASVYDETQRILGEPVYFHACMGAFFHQLDAANVKPGMLVQAAGVIARHAGAVGDFLGGGPEYDKMAAAVKAAGAEWSEPMFYQYENIGWGGNRISNGFDILRDRWQRARENGSTLIQFVTWNDYTENTHLAPAYDTRYAILDLNAYFIEWWKTGKEPTTDHDRVYLSFRKYPKGAKIYPFQPKQPDAGGMLEVLTILTKPGTVRLPGRGEAYEAPAGMFHKQFPLKPGKVIVELVRDGKVDVRLESPERITDRPFREQNGMACFSTEFIRHWKADFGGARPYLHGEYDDEDGNGLPNWFEMYWFGKFLDYSTATGVDPNADPDGDGRSNLQEYLDQTDPTTPDTKDKPARSSTQPTMKVTTKPAR